MAALEIRMLGRFVVTRGGSEVAEFGSDSAKALLALLAAEPGRVWSRPVVAEMLWPERPPGGALGNLRHTLSVLRHALDGGTELVADRSTIALASTEDTWVDLVEFEHLVATSPSAPHALEAWQRAVGLWRGEFLDGLHPAAGAEWEHWRLATAERCRRNLVQALRQIADQHEQTGRTDLVVDTARRLVEVDPWDESAHRQLMEGLAALGERAAAISHYAALEERFLEELGAAPAPQTAALIEQIRSDANGDEAPAAASSLPKRLTAGATEVVPPVCVGRGPQLDLLRSQLDAVLSGRGRIVLIAGEAGSGKTTLTTEFMRRATDVTSVSGRCNAVRGLGDPYLPFREALSLLSGDVETGLKAGRLTLDHATRLWSGMPRVARLIHERGSNLLGVMIDGPALVQRAALAVPGAGWLHDLRMRVESMTPGSGTDRIQPALFDEYTSVLAKATENSPVVLVIDDLQWADAGSMALLWHLARRLDRLRILLVCAYRPEDIEREDDATDALAPILRELAVTADQTIELGGDRQFVDALVDSEPNELDHEFRRRLFSSTGGHALFTVEVLRGMQHRAELVRNPAGRWTPGQYLDWERIPARVEAAIAQRIDPLPIELRTDLCAASVQGESFVVEAVAAARTDAHAQERLRQHGSSLGRVIEPAGADRLGEGLATTYRFRHALFQQYLYGHLDAAERMRLHQATGRSLEQMYLDHPHPPVVDLAYHFERARLFEPTIRYLEEAAQRALRMAANEEAIRLLDRAHRLLPELPESPDRDERQLELLVLLAAPVNASRGWGTPEAHRLSDGVRELSKRVQPSSVAAMALIRLAGTYVVAGRFVEAARWSKEALAMSDAIGNPTLQAAAAFETGFCLSQLGELAAGHEYLRTAHELGDAEPDAAIIDIYGVVPGPQALAQDGRFNLWHLGYPDRALEQVERAVQIARAHHHPFTLCHALGAAAWVRSMHGNHQDALDAVAELEALAAEHHFPFWTAYTISLRGRLIGEEGDHESGIGLIEEGLAQFRAVGIRAWLWWLMRDLAELELQRGNSDRAIELIDQAELETDRAGEPVGAVVLSLERGRLLRCMGDSAATDVLSEALAAVRSFGARMLELEGATELALLDEAEGRTATALETLAPVYDWFEEGFDSPQLMAAAEVLHRLRAAKPQSSARRKTP